jgi:hypothetical protein
MMFPREKQHQSVIIVRSGKPDLKDFPEEARAIQQSLHKRCLHQSNYVDRCYFPPNGSIFTGNYVSPTRSWDWMTVKIHQPALTDRSRPAEEKINTTKHELPPRLS